MCIADPRIGGIAGAECMGSAGLAEWASVDSRRNPKPTLLATTATRKSDNMKPFEKMVSVIGYYQRMSFDLPRS